VKQNLHATILLFLNQIILHLNGLINHSVSSLGIFLYLPALFLFPALIHLDPVRSKIVIILTGISLDHIYSTPLGFHVFSLLLCFLFLELTLKSKTYDNTSRPFIIHLIINFLISCGLFLLLFLYHFKMGSWDALRFMVDVSISSLLFFVLCPWFSKLNLQSLLIFDSIFEKDKI
tara:strand:- start:5715 stop:6239 length:525 start_codon:yes stop_codon:yes gene_type:complete